MWSGLVIAGTVLTVALLLVVIMIVMIVMGIIFAVCKKKITSGIFFSIAWSILMGFNLLGLSFSAMGNGLFPASVDTPEGTKIILSLDSSKLLRAIEDEDIEEIDRLLDKCPELVYFNNSSNGTGVYLEAIKMNNVEMYNCAVEHGAKEDDPYLFDRLNYKYSVQYLFVSHSNDRESVIPMLKIMLENGAELDFEKNKSHSENALFSAVYFICSDNEISEEDVEIIELLIKYGAPKDEMEYRSTVREEFEDLVRDNCMDDTSAEYKKIMQLLQ